MGNEMQGSMAIGVGSASSSEPRARVQQAPLTFLKDGECAKVAKVRGKGDVHHHLENLGFVEGADVRVVSEQNGSLIVEVKGCRVALDKSAASKIITC